MIRQTLLDAAGKLVRRDARYVSLHDGNPSLAGIHELGYSWYARQRVEWDAAGRNATALLFFTGPATITHVGWWDALSGGTFLGSAPTKPTVCEAEYQILPGQIAISVEES